MLKLRSLNACLRTRIFYFKTERGKCNFNTGQVICRGCTQPFLIAQLVKYPPAMQETLVRFLGQKDPLEKGQAIHSSILGLPWWPRWKEFACNAGDLGWEDPLEEGTASLHADVIG